MVKEILYMRKKSGVIASIALVGALVVAGCSGQPLSTREKGTLGGTALGAGGGAGGKGNRGKLQGSRRGTERHH